MNVNTHNATYTLYHGFVLSPHIQVRGQTHILISDWSTTQNHKRRMEWWEIYKKH